MKKLILLKSLILLTTLTVHTKPIESYTAKNVCDTIESNKYEAQCTSALYKALYFDPKAIEVCRKIRSDYEKKSCIEVTRNKTYKNNEITNCLKMVENKKIYINKCLQIHGQPYVQNQDPKNLESLIVE